MVANNFLKIFFRELFSNYFKSQVKNIDYLRFPKTYYSFFKRCRIWSRKKVDKCYTLVFILWHRDSFSVFYNLLNDNSSRSLMVKLLVYRVLGPSCVKLPTNNPDYWSYIDKVNDLMKESSTKKISTLNGSLDFYDLKEVGFPIQLHAHPLNIICVFLLEQYKYSNDGLTVEVGAGDVVIDGGGCWGDTAIYFAHKAGSSGKVFTFEFLPENKTIMNDNLMLNPPLNEKIEVISSALWDIPEESVSYIEQGPATSLKPGLGGESQVMTETIDNLVESKDLKKVDFIKMDIEGAELKALQGAEQTIKKYKPTLAISLYHKKDDFITIPKYLNDLKLGYEFYLGLATIHAEEIVLFAIVKDT